MTISAILVMTISFVLVISLTGFSLYKTIRSDVKTKDDDSEQNEE